MERSTAASSSSPTASSPRSKAASCPAPCSSAGSPPEGGRSAPGSTSLLASATTADRPGASAAGPARWCAKRGDLAIAVTSDGPTVEADRPIDFEVRPGEPVTIALTAARRSPLIIVPPAVAAAEVARDEAGWRAWAAGIEAASHRDAVVRSLMTLQLLTYSPSGAPVAAPTTSLPERIGGDRNWDYRYAWPRDASHRHRRLPRRRQAAGGTRLPRLAPPRQPPGPTPPAGPVHPRRAARPARSRARRLARLRRQPTRADRQRRRQPAPARRLRLGGRRRLAPHRRRPPALRRDLAGRRRLRRPGRRHLDRTRRRDLGEAGRRPPTTSTPSSWPGWPSTAPPASPPPAATGAGAASSDGPARATRSPTTSAPAGSTPPRAPTPPPTARPSSTPPCSSCPLLELEPASSARVVGTVDAIRRQLSAGGPLLYRYPPGTDGLAGGEGAFLPCSFWLVQALARTGRPDEAEALLDELLPLGGPLGLFGEEMDPATGEHLGNYPQALTHAALVQAVLALDDAHWRRRRARAWPPRHQAATPRSRRTSLPRDEQRRSPVLPVSEPTADIAARERQQSC